jgi:hypothetical protein
LQQVVDDITRLWFSRFVNEKLRKQIRLDPDLHEALESLAKVWVPKVTIQSLANAAIRNGLGQLAKSQPKGK